MMESDINVIKDASGRIETADGTHILLFRYDNLRVQNKHPNSEVS